MAEWNSVHKPLHFRSGLETGGKLYDPPLLPYEIALIEALGCSEDEYKTLVRYAVQRSYVRPAEYENIPEIYAAVVPVVAAVAVSAKSVATTIAVNVAIGLALTAVSILLAPKAPALESPAKIKGKKLADQIGPTRFNQTTSFDNVSSLAEYGQPIPIPFGKRGTGSDGALTGGLILAPALVWSRMFSYGNFQRYEGIYVAGEYSVDVPELGGVRIGTTALSALGQKDFALYWASSAGNNRPTNRIAGTEDAILGNQVFLAPTEDGEFSTGFSMVYNPSGQVQFGTSNPIHNGTAYRFNWEIISAPFSSIEGGDAKEERFEVRAKRRKIAGTKADAIQVTNGQQGQPGVGREYSRRMGLVAHNRTVSGGVPGGAIENRTIVNIAGGDRIVFEINGQNWRDFQQSDFTYEGYKTATDLKDLKSSAIAWRTRADSLLTVGSRWIINASIWVVKKRSLELWEPGKDQFITLECVATLDTATVGIAGTKTVRTPLAGYDGPDSTPPYVNGGFNPQKHCGPAFHTLCQLHQATIRPVRRDIDAIEFGIRSNVWNKASGLCNFNAIPSPGRLYRFDKRDITLTTPRMDKYFERTSCFAVLVRPVNEYGKPVNPWVRIPVTFCVTGTAPIDQYNWLRIKPSIKRFYEYRIVPVTGTDIANNYDKSTALVRLNAQAQNIFGKTYNNSYGAFRVTTSGNEVAVGNVEFNEEMFTDPPQTTPTIAPTAGPTSVSFITMDTDTTNPSGGEDFGIQAYYSQKVGNHPWDVIEQEKEFSTTATVSADKTVTMTIKVKSDASAGTGFFGTWGSRYKWTLQTITVTGHTGTWNVGDKFIDVQDTPSTNVFAASGGYSKVYMEFQVAAVSTPGEVVIAPGERVFEEQSQVADCSFYSELQKSNENGPEHELVYVNEFISNDATPQYYGMSTVGLSVKSSGQINAIGQLRMWVPAGISVYRLIERDTNPSNLFADLVYYLLTSKNQGVGNVVPTELIDVDSLRIAAQFQRANKIFFDGVVEDSDSLRSFLYDNAALQLCNFTIKNGRFGMMPALPYDSNYEISTSPIAVEQIFTAGNIIKDSLQVQYIDAAQRANFRALVSWRVTVENDLPSQSSALVDWADIPEGSRATTQQAFDLTDFCTNRAQALRTARFLLSIRRRITHTVSFKTVPDALGIQPGSYIRVITEATTYSATNNGGITDAGTLRSISTIANGNYDALIYNPTTGAVTEQRITIRSNTVADTALYGCLFTLLSLETGVSVYQIEQLTLDEDGLVNVAAVHVPTNASGGSIVAEDVMTESRFRVLE
jgi:hypothetical protein